MSLLKKLLIEVNQKLNKAWYCQIPKLYGLGNILPLVLPYIIGTGVFYLDQCFSFFLRRAFSPQSLIASHIDHSTARFLARVLKRPRFTKHAFKSSLLSVGHMS